MSVPTRPWHRLSYSVGEAASAIAHFSFETFVFFYYTQVLGLSGSLAGSAVLVALVFDAVSDPLVGAFSDGLESRLGRRHGLMLIGSVPFGVSFYLLFVPPEGLGEAGLFAWLAGFSILSRFALTLFAVPYQGLGAELNQDYGGRTWVTTGRFAFASVGWLAAASLAFFVFFPASEEYAIGHLNPVPYPAFAATVAGLAVVLQLVATLGTISRVPHLPRATPSADPLRRRLPREVLGAFASVPFRWFVAAGMVAALALGIRQTLLLHANTYYFGLDSAQMGRMMVLMLGAILIGLPIWARFSQAIEKRTAFQVALALVATFVLAPPVLIAVGVFPAQGSVTAHFAAVVFVSSLAGLGSTGLQVIQGSMTADIADEHDGRVGRRQEGTFFGALNVLTKSASGLGHQAAGWALDWIEFPAGLPPEEVPEHTISALGWVYGVSIAVFALVAACMITGYTLSRRRVGEIQSRLAVRGENP